MLGVSTDRGSAQAIAPVLRELSGSPALDVQVAAREAVHDLFADGGARFTALDANFQAAPERWLAELFDGVQPKLLITGASRAKGSPPESAEQYAIVEARKRGVPSVCVLDYWGLYRQSFGAPAETGDLGLVPDWIGALDKRCEADLVKLGVPPERIIVTHNPWLDHAVTEPPLPPHPILATDGWRVLVVMQPLAPASPDASEDFWRNVVLTVVRSVGASRPAARNRVLIWRHQGQRAAAFQDLASLGMEGVEVVSVDDRSSAILAHVDLLVTVHSTVAYEALLYGTPCVSVRTGIADMPASPIDELGLATLVRSLGELDNFLRAADPASLRAEILARKPGLLEQGLFFSDGKATARVARHVRTLLGAAGSNSDAV